MKHSILSLIFIVAIASSLGYAFFTIATSNLKQNVELVISAGLDARGSK